MEGVKGVMKRTLCWVGTAILTFTIGVATNFLWPQSSVVETKQKATAGCRELSKPVSDEGRPILAFCELASNPEKYNGQTVRVSARLSWFIHGLLFYNEDCSGPNKHAAVFYNQAHEVEIERAIEQARGSDNRYEPVDIIATGTFKKVTPSFESDTIYDTAPLQFEIIQIEKTSKVN